MGNGEYCPQAEAEEKGLKVVFINFKKINSLLTKSVIYIRESMNQIEKRCCIAYEVVHYTKNHQDANGFCMGHTLEEDDAIRQEAAKKLVSSSRLYELLESCCSIDEVATELKVTREVLNDYFKYCKTRKLAKDYIEI